MHKFIIELFWLFASHVFVKDQETTKIQLENLKNRFDKNLDEKFSELHRSTKDLTFFYIRNYNHIHNL